MKEAETQNPKIHFTKTMMVSIFSMVVENQTKT